MYDFTNTSKEIENAQPSIAVFAVGAIEQHSATLPLGTDWLHGEELSRRVAKELNALLLPAIPFSMSECHGKMEGTVWFKPHTLAMVIEDIVLSLYDQGIKKIVVLNCHGGNFVLQPVIEELNMDYDDLIVLLPEGQGRLPEVSHIPEVHAGGAETSTQLYLNKENVKDSRFDHIPDVGREFLDYLTMEPMSPEGVWGNQSIATVELGEKKLNSSVKGIVEHVNERFEEIEKRRVK